MLIQTASNSWSCMPAAFATATCIDLKELIATIGHDGSEIIWPLFSDPTRRRGFVGQEIILALWDFGWIATEIQKKPFAIHDENHLYEIEYSEDQLERFDTIMANSIGVVSGIVKTSGVRHGAAWDGTMCYDPTGFIRPLSYYEIEVYYHLSKRVK